MESQVALAKYNQHEIFSDETCTYTLEIFLFVFITLSLTQF